MDISDKNNYTQESKNILFLCQCGQSGSIQLESDIHKCQCGESLTTERDENNRVFYCETSSKRDRVRVRYASPPYNHPQYDQVLYTKQIGDAKNQRDIDNLTGTRNRIARNMFEIDHRAPQLLSKAAKKKQVELIKDASSQFSDINSSVKCNSSTSSGIDTSSNMIKSISRLSPEIPGVCDRTIDDTSFLIAQRLEVLNPKISKKSIKNYSSLLQNLYGLVFPEESFNIDKFLSHKEIISYLTKTDNESLLLKEYSLSTMWSALIALCPHCVPYRDGLHLENMTNKSFVSSNDSHSAEASHEVTSSHHGLWVTDFASQRIIAGMEHEHDTCTFLPGKRFSSLQMDITSFKKIDNLMRRVRFVELCSKRKHCGKSRLDRCMQRALCRYIWNNTQTNLLSNACIRGLSTDSNLTKCNITVCFLEKLLWACPTTLSDISTLVLLENKRFTFNITDENKTAIVHSIKKFLSRRGISLSDMEEFSTVYNLNSAQQIAPLSSSTSPPGCTEPLFCDLCKQEGQECRETIEYSVENFKAMNPKWPLSFDHFRYIWRLVYKLYEDSIKVLKGVQGSTIVESGQRTMYGEIRENLTEEIIQRSLLSNSDVFTDVGSGIGQVCIQVSLTTGCRSLGYEISPHRYEVSIALLEQIRQVLFQAFQDVDINDIVTFKCQDYFVDSVDITQSTVIFFNNFGEWFSSDNPGKIRDLNSEFCKKLLRFPNNGQVFSLRCLPGAETWLEVSKFKPPINACSWMKSAKTSKDKVTIYHYRKKSDFWTCRVCNNSISNNQPECCRRRLPARQVESDFDTESDDSLPLEEETKNSTENYEFDDIETANNRKENCKIIDKSSKLQRKNPYTSAASTGKYSKLLNASKISSKSVPSGPVQNKRKREFSGEKSNYDDTKTCINRIDRQNSSISDLLLIETCSATSDKSDIELANDLKKISEMEAEEESKEIARYIAMIDKACNDSSYSL